MVAILFRHFKNMQHITIICIGKIKEKFYREAIAEYSKRLSSYCKLDIKELPDEPTPDRASETQEAKIKDCEGKRILSVHDPKAYMILLDISGKNIDSVQLSEKLDTLAIEGQAHVEFVIGGSLGVSEEVRQNSSYRLSFSKMTFPHQLMRVILLEQIYRAFRIMKNEPYHK